MPEERIDRGLKMKKSLKEGSLIEERNTSDQNDARPEIIPMRTRDFLSRNYRRLFLVPFICILLAIIIMGASKYPNPPDQDDYDDSDIYRQNLNRFNNIIEDVQNTADVLFTIGILILSFLFLLAPMLDLNFNIALKIAMLLIGVIIITHFLTDGFKLQVIFG